MDHSRTHHAQAGPARLPLIWVVDDSPTQAAFTQRSLGDRYRYERFMDGASLIERLSGNSTIVPDLVLLDWVMPGLSGDEVCRHLRQQANTVELPIVILTASRIATDDIVCALESGANDYVTKPFVPEELHARVSSILRATEMQRAIERQHLRTLAMNRLAAAFLEANTVDRVLGVMVRWLVDSVVDGCAVYITHDAETRHKSFHHSDEAAARLAALATSEHETADAHGSAKSFSIRGIATARVILTRDVVNGVLDAHDALMIETSVEYSILALEAALRSERERKTTRFHEEMVGIVGHDLRGPLSAFGIGIEILQDGESDEQKLDTLSRLQRSSTRMGRIVELLLDVTRARIGSGIPITRRPVALRALVDGVLDEIRTSRPNVVFQVRGDDVNGAWDHARIEQVIGNLASNAAQYGRVGTPITFELSVIDGDANLAVHNQNRGSPIAPEILKTVFDPFERGRSSGNIEGLGLGLYIVNQIVRAHHGTVTVTSDDNGTTFRLVLPIDDRAA